MSRDTPKRRFKLSKIALVLIVLWFVTAAVMLWRGGDIIASDLITMAQRLTRHFGSAALFGCIFFFIFKRSSRAANITFCIILGLNTLPMAIRAVRAFPNDGRIQQLADAMSEMRGTLAAGLDETNTEPDAEWAAYADQVERHADTVGGDQGDAMRALAELARTIQEEEDAYYDIADPFCATAPYTFDDVTDRAELESRLAGAKTTADAARRFADFFDASPQKLQAILDRRKIPTHIADRMTTEYRLRSAPILRAQLIRTDAQYHDAGAEMIRFLIDHWGRWSVDQENQWEVFDDDIDDTAYIESIRRLNAAIDEEERLAAQLIEHMRRGIRDMQRMEQDLRDK